MTQLHVHIVLILQMQEEKQMERRKKIAVELSDLVVYCRPVPFNEDSKIQNSYASMSFFLQFFS